LKSVLFFIESLGGGGAEAVFSNMIEKLDKNKFDVTVVSETDGEIHTEKIKKNAKYHSFTQKKNNELFNKIIIKSSLTFSEDFVRKNYIKGDYDIEVAFCEGYATKIIGNSKSKAKKIAWVHTDVLNNPWSEMIFGSAQKEKECYEKFDAVVCVSQSMKDSFVKKYGMEDKVFVLYNVIDFDKIINLSNENTELSFYKKPILIMCGRLTFIKGYERIIKICSRLKEENFDFSLLILGSGEEEKKLRDLINKLNLSDRIFLMGFQENPYKYIKNSDIFICSSYAEGYSSAVAEAVILGVPVITVDCSGMKEIFGENECGIICENSDEDLYFSIKKALENPEILNEFTSQEKLRSKAFNIEERINKIEKFLENI